MRIEEKYQYKLLVEGNDDQHVVWALCQYHNIHENFDVIDCNSITQLFGQLSARLKYPENNTRIGIVIDADTDIRSRFDSFISIVKNSGKYGCDDITLKQDGLILHPTDNNYPIIGLWCMPDNSLNGMLEDFVIQMAHDTDKVLMEKAEATLSEIEAENLQKYKPVHRAKAKIHTYLAWQDMPGRPLGQAITAQTLNADSENAVRFINWMRELYQE